MPNRCIIHQLAVSFMSSVSPSISCDHVLIRLQTTGHGRYITRHVRHDIISEVIVSEDIISKDATANNTNNTTYPPPTNQQNNPPCPPSQHAPIWRRGMELQRMQHDFHHVGTSGPQSRLYRRAASVSAQESGEEI